MNIEQPDIKLIWPQEQTTTVRRPGQRVRMQIAVIGTVLAVLFLLGASVPSTMQTRNGLLAQSVAGYGFNLVTWEIGAISAKLGSAVAQPAAEVSATAGAELVRGYLERAQTIAAHESEISRLAGEGAAGDAPAAALQAEIDALRAQQAVDRAQVEQIIEWQVRDELARAGLTVGGRPFPPVQFIFTEPPKKLVVSPRDRIQQVYYRMLTPEIDVASMAAAEAQIADATNLSGYITRIGGLGAYPAMVVDRASLPWVLSTVAHEWVHNYLTLAPLGIRYSMSQELTMMNETVAEIVGDEIGARVLARHYPELAPPPEREDDGAGDATGAPTATTAAQPATDRAIEAAAFDFRREMRTTRLEVDRLLAAGEVEAAEAYMEARRQAFVEHGYPLRVLNQAYFAFHGAYGTSPSSTDPIGPKLFRLRDLSGDVGAFLETVRTFTSAADLEAALLEFGDGP